ncbi:hypothetical protein PhaeoP10_02626 [Phaeobacter inhibens]|nr:hypothetical protein PhaeoP10_02626 [Phaeobacter inhibens]
MLIIQLIGDGWISVPREAQNLAESAISGAFRHLFNLSSFVKLRGWPVAEVRQASCEPTRYDWSVACRRMTKACWRSLKDVKSSKENSGLGCPPCTSAPIENIGEYFEKPTPNNPEDGAKFACPAALADASVSKRKNAMSLYAKDGHKRIAKAVGYALTLGTSAAWHASKGGALLHAFLDAAVVVRHPEGFRYAEID